MGSAPNTEYNQRAKRKQGSSVQIGNVTGGIRDTIIAGGNIYTRSQLEELRDYLRTAVATYATNQMGRLLKTPATPTEPYKFLDWFEIEDANIFFGREEATQALYDKVTRSRLTVLHAKSGAGKTSLLNAGLAPHLIREGRIPIFARAFNDPVLAVKRALAPASAGKWPDLLHKLSLTDFLGEVCQLLPRNVQELVLILDQFEEFFIFWPLREQRQSFIDDFALCYADKELPVRFLISLRKDYYSDLAEFEGHIPTIFQNQVWLPAMNRQQAAQAITASVASLKQPVTYTPDLLDLLLDDLSMGDIELPHLQIICTKLYKAIRAMDINIIDLSTYEHLGHARGILGNYINGVLNLFPGQSGTFARAILKELVSSEATKRVLTNATLSHRLELGQPELNEILARLVDARLVRRDEIEGEIVYEMAHEYLISEIKQWFDSSELKFKQVEELLEREVTNWRIHHTLIPNDRLVLIHAQHESLRHIDEPASECLLRSSLATNYAVEDLIRLVSKTSIQPLLAVLKDVTEHDHRLAIIGSVGTTWELPALVRLSDKDNRVRQQAAEALGRLGDARAVEPLIATLKDANVDVRREAAKALGQLGDARAVEPLIAALKDSNVVVRGEAAKALGQLGDARAVEPLIATLKDANVDVRREAAEALGRLGDARAIEPLITALKASTVVVRNSAIEALIVILKDRSERAYSGKAEVLEQLSDSAVRPLIAALKDRAKTVRIGAAEALGQLGDARAIEPLIAALKDESEYVRREAAEALGRLSDARTVEPLIAALKDAKVDVRLGCAKALGRLGDARAVEPLIATLKDSNVVVRIGAAKALGRLGDARAVERLIATLKNANVDVRREAAKALGRLGDARAVEPLIAALKDSNVVVRGEAAKALGQLGDTRAVEPLIATLKDRAKIVLIDAAEALGRLGDARAIEPLITALKDESEYVRVSAAEALGRLGDARTVEPLILAFNDESERVRSKAALALRVIGTPEARTALKAKT